MEKIKRTFGHRLLIHPAVIHTHTNGEHGRELQAGLSLRFQAAVSEPRVGRSQDPWGALEAVLPVYGPLVSYVPDGDNSDRTNSAHRESAP